MEKINVLKLESNLIVTSSNGFVYLPAKWQEKVDTYWQSLIDSGKTFTRGEVFTVTENDSLDGKYRFLVEKTDYAHYLYCQNIDSEMDGYGIRVIFTSCLVETADNKIVFGKMGKHTARAGIYQLAGGGLDADDIRGDVFDLEGNIAKELKEELDLDVSDKGRVRSLSLAYIKQGGETKKIAIVFRVILDETSEEFLKKYNSFTVNLKQKNHSPEFGEVIAIEKTLDSINVFFAAHRDLCDEYMEPLLNFAYYSE